MELGQKIKQKIVESGIPVRTVAEQIGMSEANLHKLFKRDSVETKHLQKIASLLGISIAYFLADSPEDVQAFESVSKDLGGNDGQNTALVNVYVRVLMRENKELRQIIESQIVKNQ